MTQYIATLLLISLCVTAAGCGQALLRPDEVERNRLFAEILRRQDRRVLGDDDFFPKRLLDSSQPRVQEWCALALGRIGNPHSLPWLYEAFRSSYSAVRAAAAFAVGEVEDRDLLRSEGRSRNMRAQAELQRLLEDPSVRVRARAVEALGKIGQQEDALRILRVVGSFSYDGSPQHRAFLNLAIAALMRLGNPAARPVLARLAALRDPEIQWRVANAFYRMRDREARPVLEQLVHSGNSDVRAHAARALGICGDPGLAELLTPLLSPEGTGSGTPDSQGVRVCALQALAGLGNPEAVPAIIHALEAGIPRMSSPDQINFAVQAATALGTLGGPEAEAALQRLLQVSGPVADSALAALGRLLRASRDRFFEITAGRVSGAPAGRRAWAGALGELGGDRAHAELKRMLGEAEGNPPVAEAVATVPFVLRAMARSGMPGLQEILRRYLSARDGVIVRAAAAGFRPAADIPSPWKPLLSAYQGISEWRDTETKVALLNRLEPWGAAPEVESFLRSVLQDRDRNARIAAARLLRLAGAAGVPEDPGPSTTAVTDLDYELLAGMRQDRTLAILETARGPIEIELFREDAPLTVANFVKLANQGFFDGLAFMRVAPYFVIQGGDPRNDQEGGPGYAIRCEINMRPFERGAVGMALAGKDTGGSQFFITLSPQPHLDGGYTCFGRVISGMPTAERIMAGDRILSIRVRDEISLLEYRRF